MLLGHVVEETRSTSVKRGPVSLHLKIGAEVEEKAKSLGTTFSCLCTGGSSCSTWHGANGDRRRRRRRRKGGIVFFKQKTAAAAAVAQVKIQDKKEENLV